MCATNTNYVPHKPGIRIEIKLSGNRLLLSMPCLDQILDESFKISQAKFGSMEALLTAQDYNEEVVKLGSEALSDKALLCSAACMQALIAAIADVAKKKAQLPLLLSDSAAGIQAAKSAA